MDETILIFREKINNTVSANGGKMQISTYPVIIVLSIIAGEGWRESRDVENAAKLPTDALQKAGIIKNDNTNYVVSTIQEFIKIPNYNNDAKAFVRVFGVENGYKYYSSTDDGRNDREPDCGA